jgi:transposase-like protein
MDLVQAGKLTEQEARTYLEQIRWPEGPVCPHCASKKATRLSGEKSRPGTIQCNECREQYTVTLSTVMEDTKIPLVKWVMAFHILCSSKKGVSALQLQRQLALGSYRTAWHLAHRIRHAMKDFPKPNDPKLSGVVEADETYVGGKPRVKMSLETRRKLKAEGKPVPPAGRGTKKAPVVALVERDGGIVVQHVPAVSAKNHRDMMDRSIDKKNTRLCTDEFISYTALGREFGMGHGVVKHSQNEYARGADYTNSAESFFALLKRGMHGSFHHVSKKHLQRYCDEFAFRWGQRKVTDAERTVEAIRKAEGKRLTYKPMADGKVA